MYHNTDAEVDDMNSLIHVLLYSNEVDIQGIVQSSSKFHWKGVAGQKEEKYTKPYRCLEQSGCRNI